MDNQKIISSHGKKGDCFSKTSHRKINQKQPSKKVHLRPEALVIEDNRTLQNLHEELLKTLGYKVDSTSSGLTALAMLKSVTYVVALIDMGLPDISGNKVIEGLRTLNISYKKVSLKKLDIRLIQDQLSIFQVSILTSLLKGLSIKNTARSIGLSSTNFYEIYSKTLEMTSSKNKKELMKIARKMPMFKRKSINKNRV